MGDHSYVADLVITISRFVYLGQRTAVSDSPARSQNTDKIDRSPSIGGCTGLIET
ncbi:MAG: hypothetical protein RMY31_036045 [Dendronalium sp. ChiSLP03b]|nr:hypothetical protein [Dendronalium sp. ChiSLP03b]MDZ8209459.1 hypothetical protein [Dendronalium sp. ChiSLP03b]